MSNSPAPVDEPTVTLVPMTRAHLPQVLDIESEAYPRPWSERLFVGELALTGSRVYAVALVEGSVVGYAGALFVADEAHVTTVVVAAAWRRRAVATRLLALLVRSALARGHDRFTLEVRMSDTGAQELYRRFGFAPGGVRKNYYPETREDALVMWAHDLLSDDYAARLARIEAPIARTTKVEGFDAQHLPEEAEA